MQRFLIRQPVLDAGYRIVGYALKVREHVPVPVVPGAETLQQMRDELLLSSVVDLDAQGALEGLRVFLEMSPSLLDSPLLEHLPLDKAVLAVDPDLLDADALARCLALHERGFVLALDDCNALPEPLAHPDACAYVRLDVSRPDALSLSERVEAFSRWSAPRLLARNVDSEESYEACRHLGFSLFQGDYFTRPQPSAPKRLSASRLRVMELLNLVMGQAEIPQIEARLKLDAALAYKLLRFINAPVNGLRQPVQSIAHALILLGGNQLYRWLTLLLFGDAKTDPRGQALLKNALVRGRMAEILGEGRLSAEQRGGLFITGVLSQLDALLNQPMAEALAGLSLPAPVVDALLHGRGSHAAYLGLARACEHADEADIARHAEVLGLDAKAINLAHVQALVWAEGVTL